MIQCRQTIEQGDSNAERCGEFRLQTCSRPIIAQYVDATFWNGDADPDMFVVENVTERGACVECNADQPVCAVTAGVKFERNLVGSQAVDIICRLFATIRCAIKFCIATGAENIGSSCEAGLSEMCRTH